MRSFSTRNTLEPLPLSNKKNYISFFASPYAKTPEPLLKKARNPSSNHIKPLAAFNHHGKPHIYKPESEQTPHQNRTLNPKPQGTLMKRLSSSNHSSPLISKNHYTLISQKEALFFLIARLVIPILILVLVLMIVISSS